MAENKQPILNYDDLLHSLQANNDEPEVPKHVPIDSDKEKREKRTDEVSLAARKRASKLSNPRNGYVYSTKERIIHDRTCKRVSRISDDCFEMSNKLIPGMAMCSLCRRRAWIRIGMGDDTKYIAAYDRFFRETYVSNEMLQCLFLDNDVKVKIHDVSQMTFDVNGERWMWEKVGSKVILYHNSYDISDTGTRVVKKFFHKQKETPISARNAIHRMLGYKWDSSHRSNDSLKSEVRNLTQRVAITEFRKNSGKYMDEVIKGKTIIITRYGKDYAILSPCQSLKKDQRSRDIKDVRKG